MDQDQLSMKNQRRQSRPPITSRNMPTTLTDNQQRPNVCPLTHQSRRSNVLHRLGRDTRFYETSYSDCQNRLCVLQPY
ncbi:hypothetical protein NP493_524g01028 [Ridgeia piscesae]|uniref:Uncharacterized protein n=1 Tax=Ridgeia piscesae TaxID=27915 RepID=A0AAD9NSD5_RIDPI|nr:hypothetical protein NP493_524g01028 [Ridgeia piscesae]